MKKPSLEIGDVQQLHRAGYLNEAKRGYLDILALNPTEADALHLLGILYAEEGELEEAQNYLEKAVEYAPDNPALILHYGNILKAQGLFTKAQTVLTGLVTRHPDFAAGYNNLGTVYYAQAKFKEAIAAYQTAIDKQANYIDAYYNLGLAYAKSSHTKEAINTYQALIELNPEHDGAHFQLGCLFMQQRDYKKAIAQFINILNLHPTQFETLSNIGTSYLKLGMLNEAKMNYLHALTQMPSDTQLLFNLGVINMQQSRLDEAVAYYLKAVQVDPDLYDAHNNLAFIFLTRKDIKTALQHFREALRIQPGNEAIKHTINILTENRNIAVSPPSYISSLFDSYADHFDHHLIHTLHYEVPRYLFETVQANSSDTSKFDILDLGCGTGLCGELFKPLARNLVGVDLSANMLAEAEEKQIYDELILTDIIPFLADKNEAYDLIVAGDVLVYFGELEKVIEAVACALKPNGLFVFDLEISSKDDYHLSISGRFLHNKQYVDNLLAKFGLQLVEYKTVPLRTQEHNTVQGHLYLVRKAMA